MTESILWLRPPFDPAELRAYAAKQEWRLAHEWPRTHANASELEWRAGGDTVIYWEAPFSGTRGITVRGDLSTLPGLQERFPSWTEQDLREAASTNDLRDRLHVLGTWVALAGPTTQGTLLEHLQILARHPQRAVRAAALRLCARLRWPEVTALAAERAAEDEELQTAWEELHQLLASA